MLNKLQIIGRCGEDPSVHTFENGNKVASFSFAVGEKYKKDGETVESTEWFNVKIFGKLVDVVEKYVKKGSKLYLEGKISTRDYDDKEGVKRYITEAICFSMLMLDSKPDTSKPDSPSDISELDVPPPTKDDFPFPG